MWLLIRSLALAFLLADHVIVSWPAAQWLGESDQWQQHRGGRQKRQEADDAVSPVEVQEAEDEPPPLESGSGSQWEESSAEEEEGSSDGSGVDVEGTDGSGGEDGGLERSSEPDESSSEVGSGPDSEVIEEREDDAPEAEVNAGVEGGAGADTLENGKLAEESGDSEENHEGSGNTSERIGEPENGHDTGGSGDIEASQGFQSGNAGGDTPVGQDYSVEEEEEAAVLDEVSVEAEAVHGEEGSGDANAEAEVVGQIDVGNHTDESQEVDNVLDDVEDVDDVDDINVSEDVDNVGSDLVNTTDGGNLEYEDGYDSNGELETSLESPGPGGTDSGAILCCCVMYLI